MNCETKFILSGGFINKAPDKGKAFCEEVVRNSPSSIKIVECLFALTPENWASKAESDKQLFSEMLPNSLLQFEIATESDFKRQILDSNIIIFRGGSTELLLTSLKKINLTLEDLCEKTVVGLSAGAYVLSQLFLNVTDDGQTSLEKGLGFLPIKTAAHYRSRFYEDKYPGVFNWGQVDQLMSEADKNLRYVPLKEGEFVVYK